jgi:hypothetical protein
MTAIAPYASEYYVIGLLSLESIDGRDRRLLTAKVAFYKFLLAFHTIVFQESN